MAQLRRGLRPYSPANFRLLDRASLQSDPVAAATLTIKRADPDSVKGWFMTKLLTPYLVSTACGKPGQAATCGNDWPSGRSVRRASTAKRKNGAEFIYFFNMCRHRLHLPGGLCLAVPNRFGRLFPGPTQSLHLALPNAEITREISGAENCGWARLTSRPQDLVVKAGRG